MTSKSTTTDTRPLMLYDKLEIAPILDRSRPVNEDFVTVSKKWNPHGYMKKAVKFLLQHATAALFLDPGLGKTSITLAAIKMLKDRGLIEKVLIVAPLRVAGSTWPREISKWTDFNGLRYVVLHGPKKDQLLYEDADIYIVNFDGLEWLLNVTKTKVGKKTRVDVDVKRFKAFGFDTLVCDELTKLKNTQSIRFKAIKKVLHTFRRRWGLTGSPAANGLMDLFGQVYVIDMGRSLGQYITHYRMEYFVPSPNGFDWDIQDGGEDRIYERLSPLVLRMAAEDYLDLPQRVNNPIYVDLPPAARKVYEEMEEDLISQLEAGEIVAANTAVASGKCRQIASGGIYLTPDVTQLIKPGKHKREVAHLHHEKTDALCELIDELQGSPILVAYDFAHDLDRIRERLDADVPYIGGGVTLKRSKELETKWNAGRLPYLFAHPASIAHGLNLQECGHHVGWYTLTWNYEEYDQFIKRVLRQGNTNKRVFVHHFLARDTVDDLAVYPSLQRKERGQNALFDALQALQRRRRRDR